jgi:hypothetical protein
MTTVQSVYSGHIIMIKKNLCGFGPLANYADRVLATDPEVLGSIPGASRFSERQWVWNGVHSAS